ncbi:MAG TPA: hypothetical protein VH601_02675 [Bryobacteraceae bacterium]|jgi:hypothetical protein
MADKFKCVLLLLTACKFLQAAPLVPYRAWQFHKLNMPYVSATLKLARRYDVNTVVFSHDMIGFASQLFDGSERGEKLRQLAREAHAQNLRVWIWVHEFEGVPDRFVENKVVQLDRAGFWEWLAGRYEELFTKYPEFDGLMLTFHETQYKVFDLRQVNSKLSMPDRFARMINTIDAVAARHGKDFIVRSFLYEPREMQWFRQGYEKTDHHVIIQTKCEPHDWDPFYPNNPLIGGFTNRRQIVEFDGSAEFTGKNRIPYTQPEYFERRWRYDLSKAGVVGYNLRLDHGGYDALHTPNEINIYAMYRFTEDPALHGDDVWREWTRKHYAEAAPEIERALRPTFDVVNQSFFALEFWVTSHSRLPDFDYADDHLRSRTMAKWYPEEPRYKQLEDRLIAPDPELLEQILAEKDHAIATAQLCLQHLENARKDLTSAQYDDLFWRLALLERTAIIWKLHAEAFFGYKVLEAAHPIFGLRERVERALTALDEQANVSAANPRIGTDPPASVQEMRHFTTDLRKRLAQ